MKIEVVVPDELLMSLERQPEDFRQQILLYTLGSLYESGRISGGLGARVMGCSCWKFYRLLSESGFAVIDYPEDELSMRHCGYWVSLRGQVETSNATTVTVELPRSNQFTVEAVVSMFQRISNGGFP